MELGEIYVNPALSLSGAELHFVLAYEYLHAGLQHQKRCQGRDSYLWNIACDYVINAWLLEMGIGAMPDQGLLYGESLKELSAETIYDMLVRDLKKYSRLQNLRGYGKGEFLNRPELPADSRTFGVIIDTSGSMSARDIGKALGSIASYAAARDVPYARIIFCDAAACDAGYLSVEEIAGRVTVRGRGGTCLQPGVDLLEKALDFPKDGPILLITDGWIERDLRVHRNHAFLIPQGRSLPFRVKEVFYFC